VLVVLLTGLGYLVLLLSLVVRLVIIHCFTLTNAFLASCVPRPKGTEPIDENANAYFKPS
jgi:hypothetical protein